jgi:hypothetical protein
MRRDPALLHDPEALDRLAVEAETFPAGVVRSEARTLVAQEWLKLPSRRDDALGELKKVVDDPSSESTDVVFVERELVEALLAEQRLDDAVNEVGSHPFDPKVEAEVQRLVVRRRLRRAGFAALVIGLALVAVFIVRARISRKRTMEQGATPRPGGGAVPAKP